MSTEVFAELSVAPGDVAVPAERWSPLARIAFRFCAIYFGLFCLTTQIVTSLLVNPFVDLPDPATFPPLRQVVIWIAHRIFGAGRQVVWQGSGSGDKSFDWALVVCLLAVSVLAMAVWSLLDRRRAGYPRLQGWLWLFFRYCLAGQMITYGFVKLVPLQMPGPSLTRLLEPLGDFSPMGVLWSSVGAAPGWEMFAGSAELLGGLLLLIPRLKTLGALICLADMIQVFMLNMTYDVPVKLLSLHLVLLSLLVLAPEFRRLANFFFLNRAADAVPAKPLFRRPGMRRAFALVQAIFVLWLLGINLYQARASWRNYGGGQPKPLLYGVWDVDEMTVNGQVLPPLLTDQNRWRRVIFNNATLLVMEHLNGEQKYQSFSLDPAKQTLTLTDWHGEKTEGAFYYVRSGSDGLTLDGTMSGPRNQAASGAGRGTGAAQKITMQLHREDLGKFTLVSRGFHWVQEYPYNR